MASSPITSWQIEGAKVEAVTDFLFLGSKVTAHSDCSHEIRRWLIHGRKAIENLDNVLKSRDITLPAKVYIVKAMVFPVVIYGGESWTIKKAGHQRIDAFKLWCCRRLLRVPWTARRSNQSIWKEINSEYTLEGLMLKLKLKYFDYLIWTVDSLEKSLMLGNTEGRRRRGHLRMRWLDGNGHELGQISGDGEGQGDLACCSPCGHKEFNMTGQLNNNNFWITLVDQENVGFHIYWHYFWGQLSKEEIKKNKADWWTGR